MFEGYGPLYELIYARENDIFKFWQFETMTELLDFADEEFNISDEQSQRLSFGDTVALQFGCTLDMLYLRGK